MEEEVGLFVSSVDFDIKQEEKWVQNGQSVDVAGALYNPMATFSLTGVRRVGQNLSALLGSAIVINNSVEWGDYIPGYVAGGGLSYLSGVKVGRKNTDFETNDLSGGFRPFVTPNTGV